MRYTLSKRGRTFLLFLSAASYTAWFSGLGERSAAQGMRGTSALFALPRPTARTASITLAIVRDPFDGLPRRPTPARAAATAGGDPIVPNINAASAQTVPTSEASLSVPLAVHATITGPNPVAYVENGTTMDIVRVGDTLAGLRVATIDLHGLTLANGARLDLPDGYQATPGPRPQNAGTVAFRLSDLRRLLATGQPPPANPAATANATAANGAAGASATHISTATDARPAPLRTADSRGFAVGTNPLPDSTSATPEPYPYPYAPPR